MTRNIPLTVKLALSLGIMFSATGAAFAQGMVSVPDIRAADSAIRQHCTSLRAGNCNRATPLAPPGIFEN